MRDLAQLPAEIRKRVEQFAFSTLPMSANPLALPIILKMTGYKQYYKVRFSDFRVGVRIDKKKRIVELQRVLNRRDIYRHFP